MPDRAGTLERIALELGNSLRMLSGWLGPDEVLVTLANLGVAFPDELLAHPGFASARSATASLAGTAGERVQDLTAAIQAGNTVDIIARGVALLDSTRLLSSSFVELGTQLQAAAPTLPGITAAQVASLTNDLPNKLLQYALTERLDAMRGAGGALTFVGLVERTYSPGNPADRTQPPFELSRIRPDRVGDLITNPREYFENLYGWGSPGFDPTPIFEALSDLLWSVGIPSRIDLSNPAAIRLEAFAVDLTLGAGGGLDFEVLMPLGGAIDRDVPIPHPAWRGHVRAAAGTGVGATGSISPDLVVTVHPIGGEVRGEAGFTLSSNFAEPVTVLGVAGGSRLEIGAVAATAGLAIAWDVAANAATVDPVASARLTGGKVVISLAGGDGFIARLFDGASVEAPLQAALTWSFNNGLQFDGSATLEIAIPVHTSIGPVRIPAIYVVAKSTPGGYPIDVLLDASGQLGPLTAVVNGLGVTATFAFPPAGGNVGPVDVAISFRSPTGVGLAINAGAVKGGGFLSIDTERGEYAGLLELDLAGIVTVKAIGLITTRMPDGSSGFSLLIIITAEFGSGLQLGFGFTLLAVGGLLGLNRTMNLAALSEGVRSNAISGVMFPRDIVANAARIISDLRTFFPVRDGTFLIGPMVKLGWGTPTLVSISVGVIIEIPGNIAIVGVLKVALPAEDAALIVIQVNFIGAIEFDKSRFWFFASLYDSRILFLTIEGEVGVLAAFGDDANLVLLVGGFHPSFDPPSLPFPSPKRIAVDILNSPTAMLRVEGYFAVTSNTVQFGARVDARLGFDDFGLKGYLAFDALFQFSPFHFIIQISAGLSLQAFGVGLFSISLRLQLEGVSPWRAKGTGSISLLFFDIDVDFDVTWGDNRPTTLPPIAVMPVIKAQFEKAQNWRAILPPGNNLLVSLRKLDPAVDALVLHPVGTLRISQRAIPLDLTFTKVGNQAATDAKRLAVTVTSDGLDVRGPVDEKFAPAQFQDFADADRISKPAFQPMHGGVDLSVEGEQLSSGAMVKRIIRYELTTIDSAFRSHQRFFLLPILLLHLFLDGAAVARSVLSQHAAKQRQPFEEVVSIAAETFVVASQVDNSTVAVFASEAAARDHLSILLAAQPAQVTALHVLPGFEAAA